MSIKAMLAQLRAKVTPQGKAPTKAAPVPYTQPVPPQYYQQQQAAPQGTPTQPAAPRKFGASIGWADDAAFNNHWSKANVLSNQQALVNMLNAAFSGDPSRVPPDLQGKSPAELVFQVISMAARDAAVYGSEVAMRQTMNGLQSDLPLLEATMGQQINTRTAEQLLASDPRLANNENLSVWAKHLMEQARTQDPNASAQDIQEFVNLSLQAAGVPAFQPEQPKPPKGANGMPQGNQGSQPTGMPKEVFDSMFGDFLPSPDQAPMNPPTGVPNTGMTDATVGLIDPTAFSAPVSPAPSIPGAM